MSEKETIKKALTQAEKETAAELTLNPKAELGKCVISSAGYSECKDNMTEAACDKQKSWGVKAKWYIGEKC